MELSFNKLIFEEKDIINTITNKDITITNNITNNITNSNTNSNTNNNTNSNTNSSHANNIKKYKPFYIKNSVLENIINKEHCNIITIEYFI